jgi:hypothetical protein
VAPLSSPHPVVLHTSSLCTSSPCMVILLPPVAEPALASALPRRRSLGNRPCQGTAVRDLVVLRASRSRAATLQLHPHASALLALRATTPPRACLRHSLGTAHEPLLCRRRARLLPHPRAWATPRVTTHSGLLASARFSHLLRSHACCTPLLARGRSHPAHPCHNRTLPHRFSSARVPPHRELRPSAAWFACRSRFCSTPPTRPRSARTNRSEPLCRQSFAILLRPSPAPSPSTVSVLQLHHAPLLGSAGARVLSPALGPHQPSHPAPPYTPQLPAPARRSPAPGRTRAGPDPRAAGTALSHCRLLGPGPPAAGFRALARPAYAAGFRAPPAPPAPRRAVAQLLPWPPLLLVQAPARCLEPSARLTRLPRARSACTPKLSRRRESLACAPWIRARGLPQPCRAPLKPVPPECPPWRRERGGGDKDRAKERMPSVGEKERRQGEETEEQVKWDFPRTFS